MSGEQPGGGISPMQQASSPSPASVASGGSSILDGLWTPEKTTEISPYIKMHLYGEPGSGKTVFAASAPKPLWLDTEGSTEVLDDWPELKQHCKILWPKTWADINEILYALIRKDPALADRETVVIDTLTEYQRKNLDEIVIEEAGKDGSRSMFLPYQQDYKKSTEMMRRLATSYKELPTHLILISHRKEEKDDRGRLTIRPDITPKISSTIRGAVGLQGFMSSKVEIDKDHKETFTNYLWTRPTDNVEAKTRYRHLPTLITNPTFDDILKAKLTGDNEDD